MNQKKLCCLLLVGGVFLPGALRQVWPGEKTREFPRKAKVIKIEALNHNIKRFRDFAGLVPDVLLILLKPWW